LEPAGPYTPGPTSYGPAGWGQGPGGQGPGVQGPAGWSHGGAAWASSTAGLSAEGYRGTAKLSVDDGDGPLAGAAPSLAHCKLSTDDGGPEVVRSDKPLCKLGRTLLGQRVDGTTVSIGWPNFTLIDLW